jgi:hypothetical protein
MRRVLSVSVIALAVFIGTLIIPGGRVSAVSGPNPVQVTNVPLPVTVGNFPETQRVDGTVSATQSGLWTVQLATPKPFLHIEALNIVPGSSQSDGGSFVAPAGAVIETISVRIVLPTGQSPEFGMEIPPDSGLNDLGFFLVPLQFQIQMKDGQSTYVGTVTNVHAPIATTGRQVRFFFNRSDTIDYASAVVTVTGFAGS